MTGFCSNRFTEGTEFPVLSITQENAVDLHNVRKVP